MYFYPFLPLFVVLFSLAHSSLPSPLGFLLLRTSSVSLWCSLWQAPLRGLYGYCVLPGWRCPSSKACVGPGCSYPPRSMGAGSVCTDALVTLGTGFPLIPFVPLERQFFDANTRAAHNSLPLGTWSRYSSERPVRGPHFVTPAKDGRPS